MLDAFTGQITRIQGRRIPGEADCAALQHDHGRRLEALARLGAAAVECGLLADSDRDLVLLAEDEVGLLETTGGAWAEFGAAIRDWRRLLPLHALEEFGFSATAENPLEESNPRLRRIGVGVEAWAYASEEDGSVYKFYLPREEKRIGSAFGFHPGEEALFQADAHLGDYRALLEKLCLIQALGGMATEVMAVTPEGILVAKQALGDLLPQGDDVSGVLPPGLIEIPSRFLRANRDHPRLFFMANQAWLVADLHARNFVRASDGHLRVIDLVAAPWPAGETARTPLVAQWLEMVGRDPSASMLGTPDDGEL
ncbi:MAG: hypothetical protein JWM88_2513 [Verrucomicrobia bacterium]|nr:hypothetical protein [Verrucomicrobiota bacterium]